MLGLRGILNNINIAPAPNKIELWKYILPNHLYYFGEIVQ